ncbi:methylcrotonoyl-CoA carboxylase beta chain, mitochondrial-like isoform X1 [Rhineura floridana]|uniref:methylcrotonoyl-CoA carboxylase beta chain, mitochondrial-like isoform X1 n=1 Tax=Rhineura floridana TaxID=261503 RepID=UPI002AC7FF68|nr:methylcrotonoyl-CoA carboxylase beta chain, mitochondrial-like isoform X1 [Rhineura floridana]XP_061489379.1 methylcrotonoyl-CoA carboxylase beta chain, mitochondrial-like isoform X1 [Rhineura floridana]
MWNHITFMMLSRYSRCLLATSCSPLFHTSKSIAQEFGIGRQQMSLLSCKSGIKYVKVVLCNKIHSSPVRFKIKNKYQHTKNFPVLDGGIPSLYRHVFESNTRNSEICIQRYSELFAKVSKGGGKNAIFRHTQRNKKMLVRERLKMLLDDENFLELSPFAGLDMPYGDVPAAGCLTGIGKICGVWCVFMANDATVKGGTIYPISVKKQLRAQEIAIKNRLPSVYLVDSGGAFLPLQAELFPDQFHGGRIFYNEAVMSALRIPQVAVVCGSCTAGGAYVPTMAEETAIVDKIGTMFLAGPPLVKAATGEDIHPEELGGANLHAKISGCVDHFASSEEEAYECVRNIISTFNYEIPTEETIEYDNPLYNADELLGLAPQDYRNTLHIKLILSRMIDGSRFQEFKANYGTTLVTGFAYMEGQLVGIVANNGELTHDASLKGSHFIQLCSQRNVPVLFVLNTAPCLTEPTSLSQAEDHTNRLKAQASMMAAVACAAVPKITLVIGGCYGNESYAMCGRSFDPNFLFLWPNARIALVDSRYCHTFSVVWDDDCTGAGTDIKLLKAKLDKESNAFYSSARIWDDGVILPQSSRKVIAQCLRIIKQQKYQFISLHQSPLPVIRI